ncbi:MAG: POTRA domain-containing protein, partial [Candidatus Zixiibacteriota bacterium]
MFHFVTMRQREFRLTGMIPLLIMILISTAFGQDEPADATDPSIYSGKPIRDIRFTGKYKLRTYILYREIDSRPGQPLDLELLERDRRKIDGFGIFSRVDTYIV